MTKPALPDDLLWGVQAIATHIKRTVRQTYYLIERDLIPATKLGARTIVARRSEIDNAFSTHEFSGGNNVNALKKGSRSQRSRVGR
ncbi:hypothetical protein [Bradyrhizobium sp. BR 1433]|uniref:hypothetical protein n=1 Tax=Bradyrhizobium sp. BR 1433 TaxID=3447967 RepID=UPI003EE732C4